MGGALPGRNGTQDIHIMLLSFLFRNKDRFIRGCKDNAEETTEPAPGFSQSL